MGKSLLPILAGAGLAAATGGAGLGLGAAGGTGAAGAGAAGLGLAGDALAAQGAAGLLGSAGASAAGYGAGLGGTAALAGGEAAMAGDAANSMASFGPNNEYLGNAIESDLAANSYTGGFDNLNGFERVGQRVEGFMDGGGMDSIGKFKNAFAGQQQQPQQPQNSEYHGPVAQQGQQQDAGMVQVYGQAPQQLASLEELLRQRMGGYYG